MLISELQAQLEAIKQEHGDIPVYYDAGMQGLLGIIKAVYDEWGKPPGYALITNDERRTNKIC